MNKRYAIYVYGRGKTKEIYYTNKLQEAIDCADAYKNRRAIVEDGKDGKTVYKNEKEIAYEASKEG
jgi:hypothetical protein